MSNEVTIEAESKKSFEQHCKLWGCNTELDADGFYVNLMTRRLFNAYEDAWSASRSALVVELPKEPEDPWGAMPYDRGQVDAMRAMLEDCKSALDAAGVAYK